MFSELFLTPFSNEDPVLSLFKIEPFNWAGLAGLWQGMVQVQAWNPSTQDGVRVTGVRLACAT